mmetsp:Transcript_118720/g.383349  ORF Transcript_118720/g.383349 Transcript_118720/m.383349 type:complete len:456 (+) Transcript_118720:255-1622(+)
MFDTSLLQTCFSTLRTWWSQARHWKLGTKAWLPDPLKGALAAFWSASTSFRRLPSSVVGLAGSGAGAAEQGFAATKASTSRTGAPQTSTAGPAFFFFSPSLSQPEAAGSAFSSSFVDALSWQVNLLDFFDGFLESRAARALGMAFRGPSPMSNSKAMPPLGAAAAAGFCALPASPSSLSKPEASAPPLASTGPSGTFSGTFCTVSSVLTSSPVFTNSPSRLAALLNFSRFDWKTFLQTRLCFSRLSPLNLRPQSAHVTRAASCTERSLAGDPVDFFGGASSSFSSSQPEAVASAAWPQTGTLACFFALEPSSGSLSQPEAPASASWPLLGTSGALCCVGFSFVCFSSSLSQPEAAAPAACPLLGTSSFSPSQPEGCSVASFGCSGSSCGIGLLPALEGLLGPGRLPRLAGASLGAGGAGKLPAGGGAGALLDIGGAGKLPTAGGAGALLAGDCAD